MMSAPSNDAQEAAQAPFKSTFVRLGRSVWLMLESSFRSTNDDRTARMEKKLTALANQMNQLAELGMNWMAVGDFSKRRSGWTDDEWVAFLRLWNNYYAGQVFVGAEDDMMTPEETELYRAFTMYWKLYASPSERQKTLSKAALLRRSAKRWTSC
jgi:hypothetical protein